MKRNRFAAIILFLLAAATLIALQGRFSTDSPEKLLADAFQSSGADIASAEIYFRGKTDTVQDSQKLEKIASELATVLDCNRNGISAKTIDNEDLEGVEIDGISDSNLNVSISAARSKNDMLQRSSYITASVMDNNGKEDLAAVKSRVISLLEKYGISDPVVNSCMTGSYDGKLDNNRLNEICTAIFKSVEAKKVEGMHADNLISVSAYTPSIGQAVEVNGNKVNLNVAIRYNSYEKKTYIWLATPVITTEY